MSEAASKAAARKRAFAARKAAQSPLDEARACANLLAHFKTLPEAVTIAAYMPIRTEISPLDAMKKLYAAGHVICVPVIQAEGEALRFSRWRPDAAMVAGPFGASVPAVADFIAPEILITPLVAFDARGFRIGYGGGFYDRTFELLRGQRPTQGVGFAYGAQEMAQVPTEPTDQPLDAVVTEKGVCRF